ncbi:MAG: hypothetical protein RL434_456, partial [Pseudomonadota bacterium]
MLDGKRILVTQAGEFMGPTLCKVLAARGAEVIADHGALRDQAEVDALMARAGTLDVLVANLAIAAPATPVEQVGDEEWQQLFDALVHPLPRLARAAVPGMKARGKGRILVMGSASALRG